MAGLLAGGGGAARDGGRGGNWSKLCLSLIACAGDVEFRRIEKCSSPNSLIAGVSGCERWRGDIGFEWVVFESK